VTALNGFGIGRNDRVGLVLPNGPELAVAFLAVAAGAASAPLNPAYRAEEFDFYLSDLNAKALVVPAGAESPAVAVAERRGIPVVDLEHDSNAPAGVFALQPRKPLAQPTPQAGLAEPADAGLVLHTSGTTSRPKIVPLTQANLCASAEHIRTALALRAEDRCLNVMPLFHIHGLIGAVLASVAAGASVVATPGFDAMKFFAWLDEFQPTWYTAVPTMHQVILARAARNQEIVQRSHLRLIRSSSAALPPQVMAELERVFRAPVIESYGMTEASHQMASNPLPPRDRKPGSVGVAAGPAIAILDEQGRELAAGGTGEICIRGPNVTPGYENNPEANKQAFTDGWFRTGDQGYLDEEGYLYITGRLKEIINRGGEKISPREVDEILLDHPGVQQVVTFALPHPRLGEEVAAAVVLREGNKVDEKELRQFALERLADFKVPSKIVFLEEIPKGPTGKLQRIGLAQKLGLA
jgi:acyl-CoA synthetase (AMP-forming)/AMP-acid ligase II